MKHTAKSRYYTETWDECESLRRSILEERQEAKAEQRVAIIRQFNSNKGSQFLVRQYWLVIWFVIRINLLIILVSERIHKQNIVVDDDIGL